MTIYKILGELYVFGFFYIKGHFKKDPCPTHTGNSSHPRKEEEKCVKNVLNLNEGRGYFYSVVGGMDVYQGLHIPKYM